MDERCDVLVIGGGPGGATAAFLLARVGWSVTLLERQAYPRRKVCGEYLSATNLPLLRELGLDEAFRDLAGPEVTRVGLYAGESIVESRLPRYTGRVDGYGRALGREHLDALLVERAVAAGANVLQPWSARELLDNGPGHACRVEGPAGERVVRARVVVAAHNYWVPGPLPTQPPQRPGLPGDLLAFKAHFRGGGLPDPLMPLMVFPGGYGGLVRCDAGRLSFSVCVRRDRLAELRERYAGGPAEAVCRYLTEANRGVRQALAGAEIDGHWLAAGPLRPGIRRAAGGGIFRVGNAAGEAHPVVAEGISMAMQSAWVLARHLNAAGRGVVDWRGAEGRRVGDRYAAAWRRHFAPRLRTAAAIATWAMRPRLVRATVPVLARFPASLALWARLSGKATRVVG